MVGLPALNRQKKGQNRDNSQWFGSEFIYRLICFSRQIWDRISFFSDLRKAVIIFRAALYLLKAIILIGVSLNCALVKSSTFEQEALDTHNKYRRLHGAPPLQLSRELSESGQKWANHLLSINALQHSNTNNGENLWYKWNSSVRDASGKLLLLLDSCLILLSFLLINVSDYSKEFIASISATVNCQWQIKAKFTFSS